MQGLSDEEVMVKYQQGVADAMEELLRRFKNPIYRFAQRILQNAAEAQDVAQEVFLKIHETKHRYQPIGKFSTWIFAIAHHACISRIRHSKWTVLWPRRHGEDGQDCPVEIESQEASPREESNANEVSEMLKECIQGLPFLQKEALILREYHQMEYQAIAHILNKPQGTVKTLIHRARMNLKTQLMPVIGELGGDSHV